MKTNLQKILSVSGQPGLFEYVNQANAGVIVESLINKKRNCFGMQSRVTFLSDISIYTTSEEVSLRSVLEKMREHLGEQDAPSPKSDPSALKSLFNEVLPDYDQDRFYVSHMKKVVEWYNILKNHASLDFEDEKKEEEQAG